MCWLKLRAGLLSMLCLDRPIYDLHRPEELMVALLRRHYLHAQRRVQIHLAIDSLFIPWKVSGHDSDIHRQTYRVGG